MNSNSAYCTFHIDKMHFCVEVLRVQEVLRAQQMTRVPRSSPVVRGLMNLRGQIVTALDLRRRLGLPDVEKLKPLMNVVIRTSDGPVSLLVDEIGDVLQLNATGFETPPETLQGMPRDLISGVYKVEGRLLLALNIESTLKLSV